MTSSGWAGRASKAGISTRTTCLAPQSMSEIAKKTVKTTGRSSRGGSRQRSRSFDIDYMDFPVESDSDQGEDQGDGDGEFDDSDEFEGIDERFWAGQEVLVTEYPFFVSVFERQDDDRELKVCSGGFIHPQVVITAASCFRYVFDDGSVDSSKYFVKYGTIEPDVRHYGTRLEVREILIRSGFICRAEPSPTKSAHDVALMYLVRFKDLVNSRKQNVFVYDVLRMPKFSGGDFRSVKPGASLFVSAGPSFAFERQGVLKKKHVILANKNCRADAGWQGVLENFNLCTRPGTLIMCLGLFFIYQYL